MRNALLLAALLPLMANCGPKICDPCSPPPDPIDTFVYDGPFKVIWQSLLNPDTIETVSMKPKVYDGKVVYSMLFYVDGYEFVRAVDALNGKPVWAWDPIWQGETISYNSKVQKEDKLLLSHFGPLYCIDLNSGQNVWSRIASQLHPDASGSPNVSVVGDYVYEALRPRSTINNSSYLTRTAIASGKLDTLFARFLDEGYSPRLYPPALWLSPQGDSILILQNRQWNFPASDGRVNLLAYNLSTRSMLWEVKDFEPVGNSSIELPLIYDNKVYFQSEKRLFCFDAATGAQRWSWTVPLNSDNLMSATLLVAEGKIFVKPNNDRKLYGLEPNTGHVLVSIKDTGPGQCVMTYHKGIIYYGNQGDGKMYAVKPSTGEVIWSHYSPDRNRPGKWRGKTIIEDATVSPEHNCIFFTDRYSIFAVKLIE